MDTFVLQKEIVFKNGIVNKYFNKILSCLFIFIWGNISSIEHLRRLKFNLIFHFSTFYEIKVVQIPWVYAAMEENGTPKLDENGNQMFTGYCMEFLEEMSKLLNFDYDVILPTDNCRCFGEKQEDGTWTGLIGNIHLSFLFNC